MASYTEPRIYTFKSSEAIAAYLFVIQTADDIVEQCDGAGELSSGISMSASSAAPRAIEVAKQGGGAKLALGGTVARGGFIKTDANGKGVACATDGDFYGARANDSGVDGDIISVEVMQGYFYVSA